MRPAACRGRGCPVLHDLRTGWPVDTGVRMEDERSTRRVPLVVELAIVVALALAASLLVRYHVAQVFSIPSSSMEPQLQPGDRVLVARTAYRLHDPNRGDIVVFDAPSSLPVDEPLLEGVAHDALESIGLREPGEDELIKRVIALPGETISARDGQVVVDGHRLVEPYLPEDVTTDDFGPVEVPDGHVFVLGDNRGSSSDSRVIGPVAVDAIVGRAVARIWPPSRTAFL
jgi:signal peptidase I